MIGLIWAQTTGGVIGVDNTIPWRVPEDQIHFKKVTLGSPVVMGRKTWDSLPERFRPLPGRRNIVVTRQTDWADEGAEVATSVEDALQAVDNKAWIIGGSQIYAAAMDFADELVVTEIDLDVAGDSYAPTVGDEWNLAEDGDWLESSHGGARYRFRRYTRA